MSRISPERSGVTLRTAASYNDSVMLSDHDAAQPLQFALAEFALTRVLAALSGLPPALSR